MRSTNDLRVKASCSLVFSPDSRQLISGNDRTCLQIWDIATGIDRKHLKPKA
ncbi:hypothetical protein [Chamaesiphon sp.]|uniref:hypothetical protein n=1 Tax=Chamaesiphon sp. TaxID=2814140 RepID=UPI003593342C